MTEIGHGQSPVGNRAGAVFLSYASQDAETARHLCDALRAAGVEAWFDQSELRGGDAWDAKIRTQIRDCALSADPHEHTRIEDLIILVYSSLSLGYARSIRGHKLVRGAILTRNQSVDPGRRGRSTLLRP